MTIKFDKLDIDEELDWDIIALSSGTIELERPVIYYELGEAKQTDMDFVGMSPEMKFLHMAAGMRCGKEKTCSKKIRYNTEATATNVAVIMNEKVTTKNVLEPYPCPFCDGWHVGRKMSKEELQHCIEDI